MTRWIIALAVIINFSKGFPLADYSDEIDAIYDNDIIWDDEENFSLNHTKNIQIRSVIRDPIYRWKDGIIYYYIDDVFSEAHKKYIIQQINQIADVTCLKFKPTRGDTFDYVHIMGKNNGCHSQVGRRGGRQVMNLQISALYTGCFRKGVVIHEMMHTIGFYHQHNAPDRDDYLTIHWENVQSDKISNFNKQEPDMVANYSLPFDYDSMTHYGRRIFSKNGFDTISPRDPNANIGQRDRLSDADIYKIKLMYNC